MATMSLAASVAPARRPYRAGACVLLGLLALGVFAGAFAFLNSRPVIALDRARGLYVAEGGATPFRWTSSQADFALAPHSGPTQVAITLSIARLAAAGPAAGADRERCRCAGDGGHTRAGTARAGAAAAGRGHAAAAHLRRAPARRRLALAWRSGAGGRGNAKRPAAAGAAAGGCCWPPRAFCWPSVWPGRSRVATGWWLG